jgi:hypothetical protein
MKLPRSTECKAESHEQCDGTIQRTEWDDHDNECACQCHETRDERFKWPKTRTLTKNTDILQ